MENFHRHFSSETAKNLEALKNDLQSADALSAAQRRELFRTLHTVKGGSQTFGFTIASRLAHELENLLAIEDKEFFARESVKNLFVEGVDAIVKSLQEESSATPTALIEKIRAIVSQSGRLSNNADVFLIEIPAQISSQLSNQEKTALLLSLDSGKHFYVFEIGFDAANFAVDFKEFKKALNDSGEIFATIPSAKKFEESGKIGFQIVFTSLLPLDRIRKIAEENRAELVFGSSEPNFSNDSAGITARAVGHGKTIAEKLGKQIEFVISIDTMKLSVEQLKLIFDSLLHLIRNAVDHGIDRAGRIEIALKVEKDWLKLSVSDDGRGIDSEKLKMKAVEKNLISVEGNLTEQETLALIFLPKFSTASEITEISGRGVGLDAVKNVVEKAGGKINVKSAAGMTFEIFLPIESANRSGNSDE